MPFVSAVTVPQVLSLLVFVMGVAFWYGVTGWLSFVAFCVIIEEIFIVILRFVNPVILWRRPIIPLIYVS